MASVAWHKSSFAQMCRSVMSVLTPALKERPFALQLSTAEGQRDEALAAKAEGQAVCNQLQQELLQLSKDVEDVTSEHDGLVEKVAALAEQVCDLPCCALLGRICFKNRMFLSCLHPTAPNSNVQRVVQLLQREADVSLLRNKLTIAEDSRAALLQEVQQILGERDGIASMCASVSSEVSPLCSHCSSCSINYRYVHVTFVGFGVVCSAHHRASVVSG